MFDTEEKSGDQPVKEDDKSLEDFVKAWMEEIEQARKREAHFRKTGKWLVEVYEGDKVEEVPFNILYSNTETLAPALYNNTPRPVVKPRYRKKDTLPRAAAELTSAYLNFFVDTGDQSEPSFDELMLSAVHEALVPGRGVTRFKVEFDIEADEKGPKKAKSGYVCGVPVAYDRLLHGYAKKWKDVPWLSILHVMSKDEAIENFGAEEMAYVSFAKRDEGDEEEAVHIANSDGVALAVFHEIWDKTKREVFFLAESCKTRVFKRGPDPLKLKGFYPIPQPLGFVTKISSLVPQSLYAFYENQAKELNKVTLRIQAIIAAIKATGTYDSRVEGIKAALEGEDGVLHPLENTAGLGDNPNINNAIWMWPAEKLIAVLQQLYQNREATKQVIYEITGIADILRGSTVASETATAQNIKDKWGSLRLKRFQKAVGRYVKDCLRLAAELAFEHLPVDTIAASTGSGLPREAEQAKVKAQVDAMLAQAQAAAQQAMAMGEEPPPPPQPDPEMQAILQTPSLESVVKALQTDLTRAYLVDIEANSTVDAEAAEDQQSITEFLGGMGQFFAGIGPLVENGTLPFPAAKAMMLAITRKYRIGREVDEALEAMQAPQPQGGAEMEKVKKEQEALVKEREQFAAEQQKFKEKMLEEQMKLKMAVMQHKMQVMMDKMQLKMQDVQMKQDLQMMQTELGAMLDTRDHEYETRRKVDQTTDEANRQVQQVQSQTQQKVFSTQEDAKRRQHEAKLSAKAQLAKKGA